MELGEKRGASFTSEFVEKVYVKPEWFSAYMEGNATIPQTAVGFRLFVMEALFKEPEPDFEAFVSSVLTNEQVDILARAMTNMHKAKSINIVAEGYEDRARDSASAFVVKPDRLQKLWSQTKTGIIFWVNHFYLPDSFDPTMEIEQYSRKKLAELSPVLTSVIEEIRGQAVKEILMQFRSDFENGKVEKGLSTEHWIENYSLKVANLVFEHLKQTGHNFPRKLIFNLLGAYES